MKLNWTMQRYVILLLAVLSTLSISNVHAEDDEAENPASRYVEVKPAFVTNFGGPGRLRYVKVEVTLRVLGAEGEAQVEHHLPYIRDALLSLFAIQTSDTIGSAEGKESLRQQALAEVQRVTAEEDDNSFIEDLLFTSFVAQQ